MSYLEELLDGVEVEWKKLGDLTLPTSNIRWKDNDNIYRYIDLTSVSRESNSITETSEINAYNAPSRAQKLVLKDDVIFATTRPAQQRLCLIDDEYSGQIASTGYCILRAKTDVIIPKWIFFHLASIDFKKFVEENQSGSAYPAISDVKVREYIIPIPFPKNPIKSLEIQKEIVRILDTFSELTTELTAELTAELTTRKKQYNYYRGQLLSFEEGEVKWKTLGEIANFTYGYAAKAESTGSSRFIRISDINENGKLIPTGAMYVDILKKNEKYLLKKNDVLVARTGATYGKTLIFEEDYSSIFAGFLIKIDLDTGIIIPKYYWHFAQSFSYWYQANKLVSGGGQPQFNANVLKDIKLQIPSLEEQERIVSILDKFDTLITSISEGLPKEIELRKKQYEYYRDLLLTF